MFSFKNDINGNLLKYKACLVAKVFAYQFFDYNKTFALVGDKCKSGNFKWNIKRTNMYVNPRRYKKWKIKYFIYAK